MIRTLRLLSSIAVFCRIEKKKIQKLVRNWPLILGRIYILSSKRKTVRGGLARELKVESLDWTYSARQMPYYSIGHYC